jgi:hypothetical protein
VFRISPLHAVSPLDLTWSRECHLPFVSSCRLIFFGRGLQAAL